MVTVANWQVVLIELTVEAVFQLALVVPILGGAFMVAAVLGVDIRELVADGLRETATLVLGSLSTAPAALAAFLSAVGLVALGGSQAMFLVKTGTLALLVDAERHANPMSGPFAFADVRSAYRFDLDRLIRLTWHFGRRGLVLAAMLGSVYVVGATLYMVTLGVSFALPDSVWAALWPLLVLVSTSATFVGITVLHLIHDLARIVVLTDDCSVRQAFSRLRTFLLIDARHVIGIFAVMTAVLMLAGALALLAAGGLTLVAWVPVIGVLALPIQLAAWLVRGLVFQALSLTAICAYQAQYRRSLPSALALTGSTAASE